jgi:putative hemolysin
MLARRFDESDSPFQPPVLRPEGPADTEVYPHHTDAIPPGTVCAGAYHLRFAWSRADLHAVQALRWAVFKSGSGPLTGASDTSTLARDEDERDPWFHHVMIVHGDSGEVVGTYRLQTAVMAASRHGFYSATLFELGAMPGSLLAEAVELGRACVAPAHRSGRVLRLLWKGIARYLQWNSKRYLFGCCSIDGTDDAIATTTWRTLHLRQALHEEVRVRTRRHARALPDDGRVRPQAVPSDVAPALPPLFEGYLALGAKVCSAPAFDRDFGTTDYLVVLDTDQLDPRTRHSFFG